MSVLKVTVILENKIQNQPPFGFSFLLIEVTPFGYDIKLMPPVSDHIDVTDWKLSLKNPVAFVYGSPHVPPIASEHLYEQPRGSIFMRLRNKQTGKTYELDLRLDRCTIIQYDDIRQITADDLIADPLIELMKLEG